MPSGSQKNHDTSSYPGGTGGRRWNRRSGSTSRHVRSVHGIRHPPVHARGFSNHFPSPPDRGQTFPLISSQGNTTVLTVVDRFSKMVKFIALLKLPSAKETAEVKMNIVFRVHRFPRDVSDWGPQFVSQFWREFCRLIGAKASLTSGYHPEANGQTKRLNRQLETGLLDMEQTPGLGRVCTILCLHLLTAFLLFIVP